MLQNPPRNHSSELTPPATPDARTYYFANGPKRCSGRSLLPCREVFTRRLASNDNPLGREPLDAFSRSLHTHHPQTHWFGLTPRSGATTSCAAIPSSCALGYALSSFGLAPLPPLNRCKLPRPNSPRKAFSHFFGGVGDAHALAATARRGFDHDRIADLVG